MIRFDGNTILVSDNDKLFGAQLIEILSKHGAVCFFAGDIQESRTLLKKYDFDLVVANYYLSDGIIHNLIDWSSEHLATLPIFTCFSYPLPGDIELSHKHSIATTFSKNDPTGILAGISNLLFDFHEFHESLMEMISPTGILMEAQLGTHKFMVEAYELTHDCVFLHTDEKFSASSFGVMKFSLLFEDQNQNFVIPGFFEGTTFKINKNYQANWNRFLKYLNYKQINITSFMKKAAGF